MAAIFGNESNIRGCFMAYTFMSTVGRGAKLMLPGGGQMPKNNYAEPLLVTGFSYTQQEAVAYVKVFGEWVYTYAFGHDPGPSVLTVEYLGFLVNKTDYSGVVGTVNGNYNSSRVYNKQTYAKLALGSGSDEVLKGFVIGMGSQTADPEVSLQRFQITIGLVEAQG